MLGNIKTQFVYCHTWEYNGINGKEKQVKDV